jgi:hypothetical protein
VHLFDNSEETVDGRPQARRVMRMKDRMIVAPPSLDDLLRMTPEWAKPVVVVALKVNQTTLATRRNRGPQRGIQHDVLQQLPGIPWRAT